MNEKDRYTDPAKARMHAVQSLILLAIYIAVIWVLARSIM